MIYATETDIDIFSNRLYRFMKRKNHDVHSLGKLLGISGASVLTFLDGSSFPCERILLKFALLEVEG